MTKSSAFVLMGLMKTLVFQCAVLSALLLVGASGSVKAVPPKDANAAARAAVYQAETRAVFAGRGWGVARDKPGVLIMEHNIGFSPSYGGYNSPDFVDTGVIGVAQVIFTFKPASATDTSCTIDARQYSKEKQEGSKEGFRVLTEQEAHPSSSNKSLNGPYPIRNEEMLKTIRDLLGKARARLIKSHPEFAAQ